MPVSPKMNRSPIREALGAGIMLVQVAPTRGTNSSGGETECTLVTTAHEELSTSAVRVLLVGSREEDVSLVGFFWQKPGRAAGGTGPCEFAEEPKDGLGGNEYDLVL